MNRESIGNLYKSLCLMAAFALSTTWLPHGAVANPQAATSRPTSRPATKEGSPAAAPATTPAAARIAPRIAPGVAPGVAPRRVPGTAARVAPTAPAPTIQPSPHGCAQAAGTPQQHIQWSTMNFATARKHSQQTGCHVLVDMYATWCYPCKRYDREVFNKADVAKFVHKNFIPLRRDGLKGEGKMLASRYNCVTYPCILVLDSAGKEVERITAFLRARPFVARLSQIKRGKDTLASLLPLLKQRPNDAVLRYRIGHRLAYRGDARCIEHLRFVGDNPPPQYPWLGPRALYTLGRIYYRNTKRDCPSTLQVLQLYLQKYPTARRVRRVRQLISWCQRRLQKK